MDARIKEALKSDDPKERAKGVKALAQTESKESIQILARIYKQDPDPTVRDLALKAGRHIKKMMHAAKWENEGTPEVEYVDVDPENEREARVLMNKALQSQFTGDVATAEPLVRKAFRLNPNLRHNADSLRIAADVLGIRTTEVEDELLGD